MLGEYPWLEEDARQDYGETRCRAFGILEGRLLVVVFTVRDGVLRIISARKANARERRSHERRFS